ncbi:B3 domain-containing protein Os02g0764100-like [Tripterygium wilfordii]|uniref:B3 domain-containing protein Os02g0764100-like n=1 Tax=Tripterygium wilfordii TaxID=458696 RepID=UPI0018F8021F|nr:B3 domain-containing protein Os02g0764100-like [Tripterygium wilfordii]
MAVLFEKILTPTDITKRLSIPSRCLADFASSELDQEAYAVELKVKDHETGYAHSFYCTTRKRGYKKPVFSKGWIKFVRQRNLRIGDKVVFLREEDGAGGVVFKIGAKRRMRLMGFDFG